MAKLSSDFLEEQFGPTDIEILYQDELTRIISTETSDGQVLELSRVEFEHEGILKLPAVHLRVVRGESMGKVFRDSNISFVRDIRSKFRTSLPDKFSELFGSSEPAIVMDVVILVGSGRKQYARILETYTPLLKKYQNLKIEIPDDYLSEKIQIMTEVLTRQ